jgi:hypothetical protein
VFLNPSVLKPVISILKPDPVILTRLCNFADFLDMSLRDINAAWESGNLSACGFQAHEVSSRHYTTPASLKQRSNWPITTVCPFQSVTVKKAGQQGQPFRRKASGVTSIDRLPRRLDSYFSYLAHYLLSSELFASCIFDPIYRLCLVRNMAGLLRVSSLATLVPSARSCVLGCLRG